MTPATGSLFTLSGQLFELLELRDELLQAASGDSAESQAELMAVESGIRDFVVTKLREVDGLRAPLKALEQGVALNKADAAAATNRAMILQNRYDRLKDLIKQCMVALDQAGEWKPKESRKFESARGSFTLRGNGGAQPVEITDEALVPDEYKRAIVRMPANLWSLIEAEFPADFSACSVSVEVSKSAVAEALAKPCPKCGHTAHVGASWNNSAATPCEECGGSGKQGVPGARLAPRGESLQIK